MLFVTPRIVAGTDVSTGVASHRGLPFSYKCVLILHQVDGILALAAEKEKSEQLAARAATLEQEVRLGRQAWWAARMFTGSSRDS